MIHSNAVIEHAVAQAISRDDAARKYEARKLTSNGWHWPVERRAMRHGPTLRTRMVEDLRRAALATGLSGAPALYAAGWSLNQVEAHAERALEAFSANQFFRVK